MFELSLFPLNTVLFPSAPIHLHIFEPRYLQMIGNCIQDRQPFGVVLIRHGMEALGPLADPHRVGCTAEIAQVEKLPQDRLNIVAVGRERFRIHTLDNQRHPYLAGMVELFPLPAAEAEILQEAARELRPWVERYLRLLSKAESVPVEYPDLPPDPLELAYLGAASLQMPPIQKQSLLEAKDAGELFASLLSIFRREIALMQSFGSKRPASDKNPFSKN